MIKPPSLKNGDTVALIAPSSPIDLCLIDDSINSLKRFGLNVIVGKSCFCKHGYLSGTDYIRANDINSMFANKNIKGIFALRGGYGSARLLNLIDYITIKDNPKIFVGYSDITALHIAINQICDLITYHGPMVSTELINDIDEYTAYYFSSCIFKNDNCITFKNPEKIKIETLYDGYSEGNLIGGNLSLICSSLGTKYEINTKNKILFLEEVEEPPYKIDRMLLQLHQAGKFKDANGIILGAFTNCNAKDSQKSLSLLEVFEEIILPNQKPTLYNLACGHCMPTLTLPLGSRIAFNTKVKEIKLLE